MEILGRENGPVGLSTLKRICRKNDVPELVCFERRLNVQLVLQGLAEFGRGKDSTGHSFNAFFNTSRPARSNLFKQVEVLAQA